MAADIDSIRAALERGEAVVGGVLSGTSGDGIDVGFARLWPRAGEACEVLAFETVPFAAELGGRVRAVLDGAPLDLRATALLSRDLGRAFGRAAREVADAAGLAPVLVGSHGQTVYHHDGREMSGAATLQLGDGDFVCEEAGCAVASDFRQRDIAAGGEGAPLSALADPFLFAALPRPSWVLNLGGMANLTMLAEGDAPELAFDTGPAGALLDGLARRLLDRPFDEGGAVAARGAVDEGFVAELCEHEFLRRQPPKSTGRDTFGEAWVERVLERARARGLLEKGPADLLASAVDFVARTVVDAARSAASGRPAEWLVACGGGVHHARLLDALAARSPWPLATGEDFGVPADAREALVFAWLAAACAAGRPLTSPSATGARRGRVLGKLSLTARSA